MEVTNKCGEVEPQPMEMTNSGMAPMSGHALPAPPAPHQSVDSTEF